MALKAKTIASSSSVAAAPTAMGGSFSQEAPISGKLNGFRHWEHEEVVSS